MRTRKPVEANESAPVVAESKPKTVRKKAAEQPKTPTSKAAHKHHPKKSIVVVETEVVNQNAAVSGDAIARLAYSYWEARGYQDGNPEQDWLRAERELLELAQNR